MSGDYLTKLRQKPKHVRDNIAFGIASGCTAVVAAFLVFAVHGPTVINDVAQEENSPQFFQTLTSQVKEQVAATRSSLEAQKPEKKEPQATPAANGSGAPAPAVLIASSSIEVASTSERTVLIATTSVSTDDSR